MDKVYKSVKGVRENRAVMEGILGRTLGPKEVVHHINGDSLDNRPENLMLFENNAAHLRFELAGKNQVKRDDAGNPLRLDKEEICKRVEMGWSQAELGREFGVSRQRINTIVAKGRAHWNKEEMPWGRPEHKLPEGYMDELKRIARHE